MGKQDGQDFLMRYLGRVPYKFGDIERTHTLIYYKEKQINMGLFTVRKPRGFRRSYIYYDERKEKRQQIKENAERELGLLPEKEFSPEDIRGKFVQATKHLKRRKEKEAAGKKPMKPMVGILLIIALIALMFFLMM